MSQYALAKAIGVPQIRIMRDRQRQACDHAGHRAATGPLLPRPAPNSGSGCRQPMISNERATQVGAADRGRRYEPMGCARTEVGCARVSPLLRLRKLRRVEFVAGAAELAGDDDLAVLDALGDLLGGEARQHARDPLARAGAIVGDRDRRRRRGRRARGRAGRAARSTGTAGSVSSWSSTVPTSDCASTQASSSSPRRRPRRPPARRRREGRAGACGPAHRAGTGRSGRRRASSARARRSRAGRISPTASRTRVGICSDWRK